MLKIPVVDGFHTDVNLPICLRLNLSRAVHALAHALQQIGESDEAIAVFKDLARLRPGNGLHLGCLGHTSP